MKILALLMMFCSSAFAQWTPEQKTLATIYMAAHIVDWGQTRTIAKHPDRWQERNPILGRHPSVGQTNAYFALVPIVGYLIVDNLPSETRTTLLRVAAVAQVAVAANNARIGIHMSF